MQATGKLVWITGLSGAGKTTLAHEVYLAMKTNNLATVFIDGDDFRYIFDNDLGYSSEDRVKNAFRIAKTCRFLTDQNIDVVCATISLFQEIHDFNRKYVKNYFEIYIHCDFDELTRRDQKQLYSSMNISAKINEVKDTYTGRIPKDCHLVIDNTGKNDLEKKVSNILSLFDTTQNNHPKARTAVSFEPINYWKMENQLMHAGDFSELAESYAKFRPNYSTLVRQALVQHTNMVLGESCVADVGAGTGIWTKMLADINLKCVAVEPNDAMRQQGENFTNAQKTSVQWHKGSGEETGLETASVNWVTMASSFHWVRRQDGLAEFSRILKPNGHLTVLWNPREIEKGTIFDEIEELIKRMLPDLKRVSSGASHHSQDYHKILTSTGHFKDVLLMEATHEMTMSKDRYLGIWRSVNDIQRQAGTALFEKLLQAISDLIGQEEDMLVPYKTRAWTAQKK
jgi:adenylylsulfate kinase-like enzyme/ubiquinone/menaquinone biosynthesis C-methylase UbiE